jgi:GT2 family glycosyltransferase
MTPQPSVSLLLPNKDNGPVLDLFFERLAAHTTYPNHEIIVADDGSTDRSLEILRRWRDSNRFPNFTLLEREHAGIVETLNAALDAVSGEVIVRLDGDATVETRGWLEKMLAFQGLSDANGVTVAKMIFDSGLVHTCGVNLVGPGGMHDRGARLLAPGVVERVPEREAEGIDVPAEVDAALGCWTMFPTELAREIGGWDPRYWPVWIEDVDFAFAARVHGRKVFYLPDVRVVHRVGMRNPRIERSRAKLGLFALNRRIGRFVPSAVRASVAERARLGEDDPDRHEVLVRHFAHWREKWGFDALYPDVDAILERYRGTEVGWAYDPEMRRAGEEIVERHLQATAASAPKSG